MPIHNTCLDSDIAINIIFLALPSTDDLI
jgi:hypothetical protein